MLSTILIVILCIIATRRVYKNRAVLKQLTRAEWLRLLIVFVCAWASAAIIIIGGMKLVDSIEADWIRVGFGIAFVIIGLNIAGMISEKFLPQRLKKISA